MQLGLETGAVGVHQGYQNNMFHTYLASTDNPSSVRRIYSFRGQSLVEVGVDIINQGTTGLTTR